MEIRENLRYSQDHEWVQIDDDIATIGISDYAQEAMGDVVFVELPEVGNTVAAGEAFGVVESVKAVSDLYAPVSGEVVAINSDLEDAPDNVNTSPYDEAWIVKIKVSDSLQLNDLMGSENYRKYVEGL